MKNLKNKVNFLFCFSIIFFIIVSFFHFLIINNKNKKEARAAGGMSIGAIATVVTPCPVPGPGCPAAGCVPNTYQQVAVVPYGGDLPMAKPFICTLTGGMVPGLIGPPIGPGFTFLGLFAALTPIAIPIGSVGSY